MQFVSGSFDTKEDKLVLVPNENHGKVSLCVKDDESGWLIPIAEIKLFLEDATKFGEEICRRFNEFPQENKL